jgi:NTE family protein
MAPQGGDRKTMPHPRIGLALGSGAARGWAHIGVLHALADAGIAPDIVCGTSMGALVGGVHLSGHLGILEDWARGLTKFGVISQLDFTVAGAGMIGGRRLIRMLERYLADVRVEGLPLPFTCVATDLLTGHEVWLNEGPLIAALRASFSLPGIFAPVRHEGRWLVDGALVNPLPVSVCQALGAQLVIAVNLHADLIGRARTPGSNLPRIAGFDLEEELPEARRQGIAGLPAMLMQLFGRENSGPSLFGVMVQSLNIMQDRITRSRLAGEPPDVAINPRVGHVGMLEFHRAAELIDEGRAATERMLPELRDAIALYASVTG